MAEYRGAKFCHRCNTVDTSGFCGPGGGFFSLSSSSGLPLLLLPLKPPPGPQKPLPGPPPYSLLGPPTIIEGLGVVINIFILLIFLIGL